MRRYVSVRIDRNSTLRRKYKRFFARFLVDGKRRYFLLGRFRGDYPTEQEVCEAERALDLLLKVYRRRRPVCLAVRHHEN